MAWTEEQKQKAVDLYAAENPTPETSTEIIKSIAEQLEQTPNGVRMILIQAGVYVKKAEAAATDAKKGATGSKASGEAKGTRVSKESQIKALKDLITAKGGTVDDEILDKLTGKAAAYLVAQFGG